MSSEASESGREAEHRRLRAEGARLRERIREQEGMIMIRLSLMQQARIRGLDVNGADPGAVVDDGPGTQETSCHLC